MEREVECMPTGVGAVSCVTGFSKMIRMPTGDRMYKLIRRTQTAERGVEMCEGPRVSRDLRWGSGGLQATVEGIITINENKNF